MTPSQLAIPAKLDLRPAPCAGGYRLTAYPASFRTTATSTAVFGIDWISEMPISRHTSVHALREDEATAVRVGTSSITTTVGMIG